MPQSPTAAHTRYRNKNNVIVPGVTTVIGLLAKPALINWAWRLGMAGEDMNKVRDLAANIGTCAHYLVECYLTGEEPETQHFTAFTLEQAVKLAASFKEWHGLQDVETLAVEEKVVSENWQFGGMIDWVAKLNGVVTLLDIKTSRGIYDEYRIQLAAYREAWNELHPKTPVEKVVVIHLDKETFDLAIHPFSDLETEFEIFKHLRAIYVLQKKADPKRTSSQTKGYRSAGRATVRKRTS